MRGLVVNWRELKEALRKDKAEEYIKKVEIEQYGMSPYPEWVCKDCAYKAGGVSPRGMVSTFHRGKCDVCGEIKSVTEPRDYGYPKFEGYKDE